MARYVEAGNAFVRRRKLPLPATSREGLEAHQAPAQPRTRLWPVPAGGDARLRREDRLQLAVSHGNASTRRTTFDRRPDLLAPARNHQSKPWVGPRPKPY